MNRKIVLLVCVIFGIGFAGVASFFIDTGEDYQILTLEITYTAQHYQRSVREHYTVERVHGKYYSSTGSPVDSQLLDRLIDSFTDFYESEDYETCEEGVGFSAHFTVKTTLKTGEIMIMNSDSSCHCFIPWNIMYKGRHYTQYNGKIPTALLNILIVLDSERWSYYEKDAQWGCYSGEIPDIYVEKGFSSDFPQSIIEKSPEEMLGAQHVLWNVDAQSLFPPQYLDGILVVTVEDQVQVWKSGEKMWETDLESIIMPPQYADGILYITVNGAAKAINSKTGELVWEYTFEKGPYCSQTGDYLAVHDGAVYLGTPKPALYKLDADTGVIIWEYGGELRTCPQIRVLKDNLLIHSTGIFYLDAETGEKIWEIPSYVPGAAYYEDVLFINGVDETGHFFYALIDHAGDTVWREDSRGINNIDFEDGVIYIDWVREMRVAAVDAYTAEELWSYDHGKTVMYQATFDDGVFLLIGDEKMKVVETFVHVGKDGSIWEYPIGSSFWGAEYSAHVEVIQDTVILVREGGFIEAFDVDNGNKLWETEIRGSKIGSVTVYEGRIYVCADDGAVYCVDVEHGEILWMVYAALPGEIASLVEIVDGLIFVDTGSSILVLSV